MLSPNQKKGFFISFEGIDATGKSVTLKALKKKLADLKSLDQNFEFVFTREPGGSLVGEQIRQILLNPQNELVGAKTQMLLFAASRSDHIEKVIAPALAKNKVVITDRYLDSSLVYQGLNTDLGLKMVEKVNNLILNGLYPDITFYFEIDDHLLVERLENRQAQKQQLDSFDRTIIDKLNHLKQFYQEVIDDQKKQNPHRKFCFLNGADPVESNVQIIIDHILGWKNEVK